MKQFYLLEIVTKDKLIHQGLFFRPKKAGKKAILYVHGLTDNFYGDIAVLEVLAQKCEKEGWGLAAFNNRGHDIVASISRLDPSAAKGKTSVLMGSAYERFEDCVFDIDAGFAYLVKEGFSQIVLGGISTGANKTCYYAGTQHDTRIVGVILASPISDVPVMQQALGLSYRQAVEDVDKLVKSKKTNKLIEKYSDIPMTAERFLSLYRSGGAEDTFPYYDHTKKPRTLSNIEAPVLVVLAGNDEYADRPAKDIRAWFARHVEPSRFTGTIIPRAFHSFGGKEVELSNVIFSWFKKIQ